MTLTEFQFQIVLLQYGEKLAHMILMLLGIFAKNNNIVQVDTAKLS